MSYVLDVIARAKGTMEMRTKENAMIMISIDGNRSLSHSRYPDASEVMTKAELESIADQFDYSVQPKEVDRAVVEEKLAVAEAAYQAEHAYVPETCTDFSDYLKKNVYIPDESRQYSFYDRCHRGTMLFSVSHSYFSSYSGFSSELPSFRTEWGISMRMGKRI